MRWVRWIKHSEVKFKIHLKLKNSDNEILSSAHCRFEWRINIYKLFDSSPDITIVFSQLSEKEDSFMTTPILITGEHGSGVEA